MNEIRSQRPIEPASEPSFEARVAGLLFELEQHDKPTRYHSTSVAAWSRRIAKMLAFPMSTIEHVERCALLHDVGKIYTPIQLLTKPGSLTVDEWVHMKTHAADGAALLEDDPALAGYAEAVRSHHERYDGRGYPSGLRGDAIPFEARIIAVADSFDAMISQRYYGIALSPSAALEELQRCRGSQFEPAIVDCLTAIVTPRRRAVRQKSAQRGT